MPEVTTQAAIVVTATGGDAAAASMGKVAASVAGVGTAAEKAGTGMKQAGQGATEGAGSFRAFRGALSLISPELGLVTQEFHHLEEGSKYLGAKVTANLGPALGALAGPVGIAVVATAGLIAAAWLANAKAAEELEKQTSKNIKTHGDLLKNFEDLQKSGVKLTATQREYLGVLKTQYEHERALTIEQLQSAIARKNQEAALGSFMTQVKLYWAQALGLHNIEAQLVEDKRLAAVEVKRLQAELESWLKTGKSLTESLGAEGKELNITTEKVKEYEKELRSANKELAKPSEHWKLEREEITEWAKDQYEALDKAKADHAAYAKLREATAAKLKVIDKKESDERSKVTMEGLKEISDASAKMGSSLIDSMARGTGKSKEAFTAFRDSIVQMFEDMIAKALVLGALTEAFGGAAGGGFGGGFMKGLGPLGGLFGGGKQFGGKVPGPEGVPALVLAHGGETVGRPTGAGMGGGNGGSTVVNNFKGGIGGLNPADQRIIGRQMRQLIRSSGDLGLV